MGRCDRLPLLAAPVLLGVGIALNGCSEVKSTMSEAAAGVGALFAPSAPETPPSREAEAVYRDAVSLRGQGRGTQAIERLEEAAHLGHAAACYELGMLYTQGRELPQDLDAGAKWINRAADLGDARAQYLVGANLMSGAGVQKDPARGVAFLARAGEQGHVRAQYLLGQAYVDGVGVPANPSWAARWYGRAARAGHADAQYAYGVMYASGLGVPKNDRQAYRWLALASANGNAQAAQLADSVAERLAAAQLRELDAQAQRFVPAPQSRLEDAPTVMFVQHTLGELGFDAGPVDGLPGARTRAGIGAYQRDAGTAVDGRISVSLLDALVRRSSRLR